MDGHRVAVAPRAARPNGGRPRVPDRNVLAGIVFVLLSSCSWANLPARQLGCGSPVTCWRRVRDWQQAGVWEHVKHDRIGRAGVTSPTTSSQGAGRATSAATAPTWIRGSFRDPNLRYITA